MIYLRKVGSTVIKMDKRVPTFGRLRLICVIGAESKGMHE
jgi:hypothetical protein